MKREFLDQLKQLFNENLILDMEMIQQLFPHRSRCSIFRDLNRLSYLSSYNNTGSFYTLKTIPQFDSNGIWKHNGVYFSARGSLKETVKYLVDISTAGRTHPELEQIVCLRIHNTLFDLISIKEIFREKIDGVYVYLNINPDIRLVQLKERQWQSEQNHRISSLNPYTIVEILLAIIKHQDTSASGIHDVLSKKGVRVTTNEVESVFQYYDLGKKNSQLKC